MSEPPVVDVRRLTSGWVSECQDCGAFKEYRSPKRASRWASDHIDQHELEATLHQ